MPQSETAVNRKEKPECLNKEALADLVCSIFDTPGAKSTEYHLYELEKKRLQYKGLSPAEYQKEIQKLCQGLGI